MSFTRQDAGAEGERPIAILVIGLLSLFRTTGIYYLRELLRSYDVVLVAWRDDGNDETFRIAAKWPGVRGVELLPPPWEPRAHHRAAAALAQRLARQVRPAVLLQHADCYPHNIYLIRALSRDRRLLRATFANGFTTDYLQDAALRRAQEVAGIVAQRGCSQLAAWGIFWGRSRFNRLLHFYLLPALTGERPLRGHTDLHTGRIVRRRIADISDVRFMYTEREREHYRRVLEPGSIKLIRHPIQVVGNEVHEALAMPRRAPRIALLPTSAFINSLSLRVGGERAVDAVAEFWSRAIAILVERRGGVAVIAKLHPAAAEDEQMKQILERVGKRVPGLQIVDAAESAERIILGSDCVVSDVSSVLWWNRMMTGRIGISLDPWGLKGSDEFRHYSGVIYVSDPEALRHADLDPVDAGADETLPSLTEMLRSMTMEKQMIADR